MKYRVRIIIKEVYTTWVEAEDEESAEIKAHEQLNNNELFPDHEYYDTEVIDTDEE